jgi:predicted nucleic acid-binding protein
MKVLADTPVWSLALRRKEPGDVARKLTVLIQSSMVVMIGPIRQEILSGIPDIDVFEKLKDNLSHFDDLPIITEDYETAAAFFNTCRKHGIQGSHIDFLICAVAHNNGLLIFTTDRDFVGYEKYIPIDLMFYE